MEINYFDNKFIETTSSLLDSTYKSEILSRFQGRELKNANEVQLQLYDILVPVLGGAIILLNFAVVISSGLILRTNVQPRSTYLFLGNVALADLLSGIAIIFGQYYPKVYRDAQFCSIQMGMIVSAIITSVYSIGLISVDRYLYIVYGLQYQRYIYPMRARIMIICTWILGIIIGFLPAMGWAGDTDNGRICWFVTVAPLELILLTTTLGLLPIIVTIVLYSLILYHALKKVVQLKKAATRRSGHQSGNLRIFVGGRQNQHQTNETNVRQPIPPSASDGNADMSSGEDAAASMTHGSTVRRSSRLRFWKCFRKRDPVTMVNQLSPSVNGSIYNIASTATTATSTTRKTPSKWTAIKVVALTTGCFIITWVPFLVASTWFVFCDTEATPGLCNNLRIVLTSTLSILGFSNGLWNPIIYAWWHNGFRRSIKTIFHKCCQRRRNQSNNNQNINPLSSSINIAYTTPTNSSTATAYTIASNSSTEVLNASDSGEGNITDTDEIVSNNNNNIRSVNRGQDVHLTTITISNSVNNLNNDSKYKFPKEKENRNTQ